MEISKEEAFRNGAAAMQAKIVAFLMTSNAIPSIIVRMSVAPQIYAIPLPNYSEPEIVTLERSK